MPNSAVTASGATALELLDLWNDEWIASHRQPAHGNYAFLPQQSSVLEHLHAISEDASAQFSGQGPVQLPCGNFAVINSHVRPSDMTYSGRGAQLTSHYPDNRSGMIMQTAKKHLLSRALEIRSNRSSENPYQLNLSSGNDGLSTVEASFSQSLASSSRNNKCNRARTVAYQPEAWVKSAQPPLPRSPPPPPLLPPPSPPPPDKATASSGSPSPALSLGMEKSMSSNPVTGAPSGPIREVVPMDISISGSSTDEDNEEDDLSRTILAKRIPKCATLKEIINFFRAAGELDFDENTGQLSVRVLTKRGKPRGEVMVRYSTRKQMLNALAMFNGTCFPPQIRPMEVSIAKGPYVTPKMKKQSAGNVTLEEVFLEEHDCSDHHDSDSDGRPPDSQSTSAVIASEKKVESKSKADVPIQPKGTYESGVEKEKENKSNATKGKSASFGVKQRFNRRSWLCLACSNMNFFYRSICNACFAPQDFLSATFREERLSLEEGTHTNVADHGIAQVSRDVSSDCSKNDVCEAGAQEVPSKREPPESKEADEIQSDSPSQSEWVCVDECGQSDDENLDPNSGSPAPSSVVSRSDGVPLVHSGAAGLLWLTKPEVPKPPSPELPSPQFDRLGMDKPPLFFACPQDMGACQEQVGTANEEVISGLSPHCFYAGVYGNVGIGNSRFMHPENQRCFCNYWHPFNWSGKACWSLFEASSQYECALRMNCCKCQCFKIPLGGSFNPGVHNFQQYRQEAQSQGKSRFQDRHPCKRTFQKAMFHDEKHEREPVKPHRSPLLEKHRCAHRNVRGTEQVHHRCNTQRRSVHFHEYVRRRRVPSPHWGLLRNEHRPRQRERRSSDGLRSSSSSHENRDGQQRRRLHRRDVVKQNNSLRAKRLRRSGEEASDHEMSSSPDTGKHKGQSNEVRTKHNAREGHSQKSIHRAENKMPNKKQKKKQLAFVWLKDIREQRRIASRCSKFCDEGSSSPNEDAEDNLAAGMKCISR